MLTFIRGSHCKEEDCTSELTGAERPSPSYPVHECGGHQDTRQLHKTSHAKVFELAPTQLGRMQAQTEGDQGVREPHEAEQERSDGNLKCFILTDWLDNPQTVQCC